MSHKRFTRWAKAAWEKVRVAKIHVLVETLDCSALRAEARVVPKICPALAGAQFPAGRFRSAECDGPSRILAGAAHQTAKPRALNGRATICQNMG